MCLDSSRQTSRRRQRKEITPVRPVAGRNGRVARSTGEGTISPVFPYPLALLLGDVHLRFTYDAEDCFIRITGQFAPSRRHLNAADKGKRPLAKHSSPLECHSLR
jgi:hypothetical protein